MKAKGVKVEFRVPFVESMSSGSEEKSKLYQLVPSGLRICAKVSVQISRMWQDVGVYEGGLVKTRLLNSSQINALAAEAVLRSTLLVRFWCIAVCWVWNKTCGYEEVKRSNELV